MKASSKIINKPVINLFLDLDETLVRNNDIASLELLINGAFKKGDLGPWKKFLDFPHEFDELAEIRIYVLTHRPLIRFDSFVIANKLNLKPRLKSTGKEFESKNGEIHFAMHYPANGAVYFMDGKNALFFQTPCFVWSRRQDSGKLLYMTKHEEIELPLKKNEIDTINSLIDSSYTSGPLDKKEHENLVKTIFRFAPVNRLITFSAEGKQISNIQLEDSDISPAYHFAHIPKAHVMRAVREQSNNNVIASILIDDLDTHQNYFVENDIWMDCSSFQEDAFGSEELNENVIDLIEDVENKISEILGFHDKHQENVISLIPLLKENLSESKVLPFNVKQCQNAGSKYKKQMKVYLNVEENEEEINGFTKIMILCDYFEILANNNQLSSLAEEKELTNPLDALLRLANLDVWRPESRRYGGNRLFRADHLNGIKKINLLLQKDDRREENYSQLIESLEDELDDPKLGFYPANVVVFYKLIIRLHELQSSKLSGFNQAAKIIILKFKEEFDFISKPNHVEYRYPAKQPVTFHTLP